MTDTLLAHSLHSALGGLAGEVSLRAGAAGLLNVLGYSSERTADAGSVEEFLERFATDGKLTEKQHELFESWMESVMSAFHMAAVCARCRADTP